MTIQKPLFTRPKCTAVRIVVSTAQKPLFILFLPDECHCLDVVKLLLGLNTY